jgi:hypothetical protein
LQKPNCERQMNHRTGRRFHSRYMLPWAVVAMVLCACCLGCGGNRDDSALHAARWGVQIRDNLMYESQLERHAEAIDTLQQEVAELQQRPVCDCPRKARCGR